MDYIREKLNPPKTAPTAVKTNEGQRMGNAQQNIERAAQGAGEQLKDAGNRMMGAGGSEDGQGQGQGGQAHRDATLANKRAQSKETNQPGASNASTRNIAASDREGQGQGRPI